MYNDYFAAKVQQKFDSQALRAYFLSIFHKEREQPASPLPKFQWRQARETAKIFREKGGIGKVKILGKLRGRLVGVAQLNLDACDECQVYPILGCRAAGLANDGAEIALGEAHAGGIITDLMLLATVQVDELNETVEDGLLA